MGQILGDTALAGITGSPPGAVYIHSLQLYADEVEVTNLHWQEFLFYIQRDSSVLYYHRQLPDTTVIRLRQADYYYAKDAVGDKIDEIAPVTSYQYHPEYLFYPVVGVSYEQAVEYCKWRSAVVTAFYNSNPKNEQKLKFTFRLPTEQEWETIAAAGLDKYKFPYGGATGATAKYKVNPKAAAYIARKISSPKPVAQVRQDLEQTEVHDLYFNLKRPLPYFLQFSTPAYVYSGFTQGYGLFHMIGNVAEMVAEKGVAKGGSWEDGLESSRITDRQLYTLPSEKVGFRCVCDIERLEE
ncbi:formylglycine-generating enzyme family protein [Pontibacter mangrovi]|nr:SUMF1/EgtB/PvdO family nonheme iron enzyme [Pontibacter mangrovi]